MPITVAEGAVSQSDYPFPTHRWVMSLELVVVELQNRSGDVSGISQAWERGNNVRMQVKIHGCWEKSRLTCR